MGVGGHRETQVGRLSRERGVELTVPLESPTQLSSRFEFTQCRFCLCSTALVGLGCLKQTLDP